MLTKSQWLRQLDAHVNKARGNLYYPDGEIAGHTEEIIGVLAGNCGRISAIEWLAIVEEGWEIYQEDSRLRVTTLPPILSLLPKDTYLDLYATDDASSISPRYAPSFRDPSARS
jgi:hypothetical protein